MIKYISKAASVNKQKNNHRAGFNCEKASLWITVTGKHTDIPRQRHKSRGRWIHKPIHRPLHMNEIKRRAGASKLVYMQICPRRGDEKQQIHGKKTPLVLFLPQHKYSEVTHRPFCSQSKLMLLCWLPSRQHVVLLNRSTGDTIRENLISSLLCTHYCCVRLLDARHVTDLGTGCAASGKSSVLLLCVLFVFGWML